MTSVARVAATRVGTRAPLAVGRRSPAPVVVRLPRARSATALSTAPSAPSTAADGTADIPEQQDSISVDGVSVGSLTNAILAMEDDTAEAMYECVMEWAMDVKGMELYEAQEEAILELADGNSVLLTTPTGSGKTLVATAAIAAATARGDVRARSPILPRFPPRSVRRRTARSTRSTIETYPRGAHFFFRRRYFSLPSPSPRRLIPDPLSLPQAAWYTAPLKALVTEKFFQLVKEFGAKNVGLLTGDASVNPTAPIICCTAEVLANASLRRGRELDCGLVVADEFHFYTEPDRGWAWQVPLVELPDAQFLLMSATFGDTSKFERHLAENRAGREVAVVGGGDRPVPLEFEYRTTSLLESVKELMDTDRAPVYIVNFTQRRRTSARRICAARSR